MGVLIWTQVRAGGEAWGVGVAGGCISGHNLANTEGY